MHPIQAVRLALGGTALAGLLATPIAFAQAAAAQAPPAATSPFPLAPPPGPQIYPIPLSDSNDGFVSLFNGTSLDGWDGDPRYWHVEDHETAVTTLTQMGFPVWSKCICAQGTIKASLGAVNVPIIVAGQRVEPGDVIIADDDGVVAVNRAEAGKVAEAAKKRVDGEEEKRQRLAKGELGLDMYKMREKLKELGLEYR